MKTILIVDDSPFFRGILKEGLQQASVSLSDSNLKIVEADDESKTLSKIKEEKPDLVFLDVVMKESENEGVNILKKIREIHPNLKVVMLSSVGQNSVLKICKDLGVEDYITKPFESFQLASTLKKALE